MASLFIELFGEEIPARMQRGAAAELARAVAAALAPLSPQEIATFSGPRRIALAAVVAAEVAASSTVERGPRAGAPEQALGGFLRKHNAGRDRLRRDGDYWLLDKSAAAVPAADLIAGAMPNVLRRFAWPKSMRWGGTSQFAWVRPLRRIVCLLDGAVVPFDLRDGADDGHGLASGNLTEGHRFHAPGAFPVSGVADWREQLMGRRVLVDAEHRKRVIAERVAGLAAEKSLTVADDPGLLDELAGLVEWPVPHLGRIADQYMDLPPEVMRVSMRVNQRYFALGDAGGAAAPWFAFVANIQADDDGAAIVAGNERVLRARFADARHFWDLDRKTRLDQRVPALDAVTFQARLGSQGDRVRRLVRLAETLAPLVGADPAQAARAAGLAKADLLTGMVGEFPELQGVMGRYYALHDGEPQAVADAIRDHYAPRGPAEPAPSAPVSVAVALADKLDQLAGFFAIGEKPTGSGDPYALRRAALGVIRIVRENGIGLSLLDACEAALREVYRSPAAPRARDRQEFAKEARERGFSAGSHADASAVAVRQVPGSDRKADVVALDVINFIVERMKVQLRAEGTRHDVLSAVFQAAAADDNLLRLLARVDAVAGMLETREGADLLAAYRRAANILRIEDKRDGPHTADPDAALLLLDEERKLHEANDDTAVAAAEMLRQEDYKGAMVQISTLRTPLDAFFDKVTVNVPEPDLRRNRLRLLSRSRSKMDQIADFSLIEG